MTKTFLTSTRSFFPLAIPLERYAFALGASSPVMPHFWDVANVLRIWYLNVEVLCVLEIRSRAVRATAKVLCIGGRTMHCGVGIIREDRPASLLHRAIVEAVSQLVVQEMGKPLRKTPKIANPPGCKLHRGRLVKFEQTA